MRQLGNLFGGAMLVVMLVAWTVGAPWLVVMAGEVIAGIKYAPLPTHTDLWRLCATASGIITGLVAMVFLVRGRLHSWMVLPLMAIPVAVGAGVHGANQSEIRTEASAEIVEHRTMTRRRRGEGPFRAYRLRLRLEEVPVGDALLTGDHWVFVTQETYESTDDGDAFPLWLGEGRLGYHYSIDDDRMVSLGR